jgi:3-deoxy-D-manno-octulosonic-acid transferase
MLTCFTHLFVQDDLSMQLLSTIGFADKTSVSGDTRFDRVIEIAESAQPLPAIERFCENARVIVAGSTWLEDEEELDHYANTHPEIKFIIAPHEIDPAHLQEIQKMFTRSILYSEYQRKATAASSLTEDDNYYTANVLVIDNIGMLSRLYKYGDITFVGGGFGDGGVHNVLEAAVYGKPVIIGPVYDKYIEAVELLEEEGGMAVATALELEELLNRLLKDEAAYANASAASKNYVYSKRGATDKIIRFIQAGNLAGG